jgi:hypothetical protein
MIKANIAVMGNTESRQNIKPTLNLKWSSGFMRISGNTQALLAYSGAIGSVAAICPIRRAPHLYQRTSSAVVRVELGDLAPFEDEGGLEAPEPAPPHPEELSAQ